MNVSTPPKHPWQSQRYEHVEPDPLTRLAILLGNASTAGRIVALSLENQTLRGKLTLFDDSHAHLIDHIHIIYGKPPRTSLTLDGLEIAHLIADAPKIEASDHEPNRVTVTLLSRKLTVENDI